MWASTLWPFSSSTRNIAFGSDSTIVPSSTMASSLGLGRNAPQIIEQGGRALIIGLGQPVCAQTGCQCYRSSSGTPQPDPPRSGVHVVGLARSATRIDGIADALEHVVGVPDPVHDAHQAHLAVVGDQGRGLRLVQV